MPQWKIGEVTITSVAELHDAPVPGKAILPDASRAAMLAVDWLHPRFIDAEGNLLLRIQALIVESRGRRIVVDTCIGNDKAGTIPMFQGLTTTFLADLAAAGFAPETIDAVVCTHLHVDHVGWNTVLRDGKWVPTFPNARYYLARADVEHWSVTPSGVGDLFGESVRPVLDAGLADLVDPPYAVTDEVTLEATPGHSPGHVSIRIRSGGEEAVITGDVMHHPVQCAQPEWVSHFDTDPDEARATRVAFLEAHADRDVLVLGSHFADPVGGYITRAGDVYRFDSRSVETR